MSDMSAKLLAPQPGAMEMQQTAFTVPAPEPEGRRLRPLRQRRPHADGHGRARHGAIPAGQTGYCAKVGYAHFNAGLATGGCGLAGGLTIVGMAQLLRMHKIKCFPEQVPAEYQAPVFSGLLGCGFALFGLIVGLVMSGANCSA